MTKDELREEISALRASTSVWTNDALKRLLARHEALLARMESGVQVRIGVSVAPNGGWAAAGGIHMDADDIERLVEHNPGTDRMTYVTAYVPRPEPVVVESVEGTVSDD